MISQLCLFKHESISHFLNAFNAVKVVSINPRNAFNCSMISLCDAIARHAAQIDGESFKFYQSNVLSLSFRCEASNTRVKRGKSL